MSYHIIWKNLNDSLVITSMKPTADLAETTAWVNTLINRGEIAAFQAIVTDSELPTARYFRNAWRWVSGAVTMDIPACRVRHLGKLRQIRNLKLQDSDADYMRALEQADTVKLDALKNYRQALRDMPQTSATEFQAAITPETIRNIQPAILTTPKP